LLQRALAEQQKLVFVRFLFFSVAPVVWQELWNVSHV